MTTETTDRRFAYGYDELHDCACPAVAAGYSPSSADESIEVAEAYDDEIRSLHVEEGTGTVSEEVAKAAWQRMVESMQRNCRHEDVAVAREIAERLGWSDD